MSVQDIINQMAKLDNHAEVKAMKRDIPPEGKTVCRFIEYIELGLQPRPAYKGTAKKPSEKVRIVFELLNEDNIREVQTDTGTTKIADKIYLTIDKIQNDKAKFSKLFAKMKYGRQGITHFGQMLGEAFQVTIAHRVDGDKTYVNITADDGSFTIEPPYVIVPGQKERMHLNVPEALSSLKVFSWKAPTKESWDSLFIDGTYTKDGKEVSKNFIQGTILSALNFKGSPLEAMLQGGEVLAEATDKMQDLGNLNDLLNL